MVVEFDRDALLSPIQREVFDDDHRFKVCAWGRRAGKTYLSTYLLLTEALKAPNKILWFIAPTYSQGRDILWKSLESKVEGLTKSVNQSRLEVVLINGSTISIKSADNINALRGSSLDMVVFDEYGSMRDAEEIWTLVIRPALSDKAPHSKALFISSPMGRNFFFSLFQDAKDKDDWQSWQKTTLEGGNVPESELIVARNDLDENGFAQEYLASFITHSGLVSPDYDKDLNNSSESILDTDTLIIGIDFNKLKMPCAIFVRRGSEMHLIDFLFGDFDTAVLMDKLERKYPNHKKSFHTDATGIAIKTSAGGSSDISIIEKYGYKVQNLRKNPNRIDRVNATNSLILSGDGTRRLFINNKLKRVVETMHMYSFDLKGMPEKKVTSYFDDVYDALSYGCYPYTSFGRGGLKISGFRQ